MLLMGALAMLLHNKQLKKSSENEGFDGRRLKSQTTFFSPASSSSYSSPSIPSPRPSTLSDLSSSSSSSPSSSSDSFSDDTDDEEAKLDKEMIKHIRRNMLSTNLSDLQRPLKKSARRSSSLKRPHTSKGLKRWLRQQGEEQRLNRIRQRYPSISPKSSSSSSSSMSSLTNQPKNQTRRKSTMRKNQLSRLIRGNEKERTGDEIELSSTTASTTPTTPVIVVQPNGAVKSEDGFWLHFETKNQTPHFVDDASAGTSDRQIEQLASGTAKTDLVDFFDWQISGKPLLNETEESDDNDDLINDDDDDDDKNNNNNNNNNKMRALMNRGRESGDGDQFQNHFTERKQHRDDSSLKNFVVSPSPNLHPDPPHSPRPNLISGPTDPQRDDAVNRENHNNNNNSKRKSSRTTRAPTKTGENSNVETFQPEKAVLLQQNFKD